MTYFQVLPIDLRQLLYSRLKIPMRWIIRNIEEFKTCKPIPSNQGVCNYFVDDCGDLPLEKLISLLEWAWQKGCPCTSLMTSNIANQGKLELLQYLRTRGCKISDSVAIGAARGGHINILEWFTTLPLNDFNNVNLQYMIPKSILENRADTGSQIIEKLKWCNQHGILLDSGLSISSGISGKLDVIQWLHENQGIHMDKNTCDGAASAGHFELLKYLIDHNCPVDPDIIKYAVDSGRSDMIYG